MNNFKNTAIKTVAEQVAEELGCSLIEAVSKMQATCVKNGNEEMLEDLITFKNELIDAEFNVEIESDDALVNKVKEAFNGTVTANDTVKFSYGEDDYCLTDGTLYAVVDDRFLPGFKKVKTLKAVEKFVQLRA